MSRVFLTRWLFPETVALLDAAGLSYFHNEADKPLDLVAQSTIYPEVVALVCLLTDTIDAAVLAVWPNLKIVANVAVGYDNIDVTEATERGIIVTNTPDVLTDATADLAWALLLAVARRIVEADDYMRAGQYVGWEFHQPHMGTAVAGKTLGIVGMGRIGTAVARRGALGFGMKVIYTATQPKPDIEAELGAEFVSFDRLLAESDFISINTPLTVETRHLFTLTQFEQMKPSAIVVNTARGPIIKEADLALALQKGLIAGAGLDVYEDEPLMHGDLATLPNVVVVPHIGSATIETRMAMAATAVNNVISVLKGQRPLTPVN